jgi:hypothetical protein
MENLKFIMTAINAIGTFLTGIAAVIGILKVISNLAVKNETLFGDEAVERYNQIKGKLTKGTAIELPPIAFGGGNIIVPKLELEKISYNAHTMGDVYKGRKAVIKYYEQGNDGIMIKRWLL